ncbi:MAG: ABC transporter permease [Armatimonadetes bacterium]|nr:ABC transporter permease [Armatimonadota bacterium]
MGLAKVGARFPQAGLVGVILAVTVAVTALAGSHVDRMTGRTVNGFLNAGTVFQTLTDTSFFAVLAVGIGLVIVTGGIDLSVGSTYALSGVWTAMALRTLGAPGWPPGAAVAAALVLCLAIGLVCGLVNGVLVTNLGVHPFVVTLGTMWIYRGLAFTTSKAESVLMPDAVVGAVKSSLWLRKDLHPVPLLVMVATVVIVGVYLSRTVAGRDLYATGGNREAAGLSGIRVPRVIVGAHALCGLCAGLAAFLGASYYGSASCSDGQGYELYAIAAAVVGGVSLLGGRGTAFGAALGALLIMLFRQGVVTLHWDSKYEWVIIGSAVILAVSVERLTGRREKERL